MDGLLTVTALRAIFDIDSKIKDPRFERALAAAGRRMRGWVGNVAYDDALLESPADATRKADLEYAEAHLVMHFAVVGLNSPLRKEGIIAEEKTEGATVNRYLNPDQTLKLQQQYLDTAEAIARPYLVYDGTPGGPSFIASDWE